MDAKIYELSDKRNLGYAEYGKSDGIPVFYFHGTPGSRLLPRGERAIAEESGIRLIAVERPGFGYSDFQQDRRLLDFPDDLIELADALEIQRFGVIGGSGGGPYVFACAYKIPERLIGAAAFSSPAPFDAFGVPEQSLTHEDFENFAQSILRPLQENADEWYEGFVQQFQGKDREILDQPEIKVFFLNMVPEAFRSGTQGYVHENLLFSSHPWGFSLQEIKASVHIWNGTLDRPENAEYLAQHIPNSTLHLLKDSGHLTGLDDWKEILSIFVEGK